MNIVLYGWPWFALGAGLLGLAVLIAGPRPAGAVSRWRDPSWLVCLMLPVYMVHQFEEHGIDLLGRHFHFIDEMCRVLGYATLEDCPASAWFIFAVNCGAVWIAGALAIVQRRRDVTVGLVTLGIPLVNAVVHIGQGVIHGTYNSGLLTAIVLFAPMCAWILTEFRGAGLLPVRRLAAVVASGVLVHAVLIASALARGHGLIGEVPLDVINAANGFTPFGVAMLVQRREPARLLGHSTQTGGI